MSHCYINRVIFVVIGIAGLQIPVQSQDIKFAKPNWWIGVAAGANLNDYRGTTQQLNSELTLPAAFRHGRGIGLYLAPVVEFHRPQSRWGVILQAGYDSRQGSFEQIITPCNCPADLSTDLSYITIEPSLRFAPFQSNLYLFAGPRLAFNLTSAFKYSQKPNPDVPGQESVPDVSSSFSHTNKTLLSMQVGMGYDIALTRKSQYKQVMLSPFVSFQPYFGQSPRSVETWTMSTLRIGAALKFGRGRNLKSKVNFSVTSPTNKPIERMAYESFPLLNYVFFDAGKTVIPNRYTLLDKGQVSAFKKVQLEDVLTPNLFSKWTSREMLAYHNVLNILGDRMSRMDSSTITLVGSSRAGEEDGLAMAQSVSQYLTHAFDIEPARINVEGLDRPKISSEKRTGIYELDSLREEDDRRVSVETNTGELLMEFQPGRTISTDTIERMHAPPDSYVNFSVSGGKDLILSWMLEFHDEYKNVASFGPYVTEQTSIPGESILGDRFQGDFLVKMIGQTKKKKEVVLETKVHVVRWTPPQVVPSTRHNVLFDFNESKITAVYKKYLTEKVVPSIPGDANITIRGYADCIGEENTNLILSMNRANAVMHALQESLEQAGRSDVTFDVYGYGEYQSTSSFPNIFPEERFYNRTVIVDFTVKKVNLASTGK